MAGIKLTAEEMRYITFFEGLTGARLHDCVLSEDGRSIVFVVKRGHLGLAIGKNGSRIRKARKFIGKGIYLVEYTEDMNEFFRNLLKPASVQEISVIEEEGKKIARISVERHERGMAIGSGGRKIQLLKKLAQRYFGFADVVIV
ncbi:MAG: NusA-like transcription termination signal-binding factor [Candidatus Hadarchaeales archaeon]